jgi:hypothetical protein
MLQVWRDDVGIVPYGFSSRYSGIDRCWINAVTFDGARHLQYHSTEDCPSGLPDPNIGIQIKVGV